MNIDDQEAKTQAYAQQQAYAQGMALGGGAIGTIAGYPSSYVRGAALSTALQFNAGQSVDAAKIVADAREFLTFLQDG
jgi:hypothetical protein